MKLKFAWDTLERFFWIVSNSSLVVFCILTGIIAETWYLSVLFFLFGAAFFVFLMINDVINRKVFIEENVLTIKLLWIKKKIQLDKVLWYTKNNLSAKNLFCKSNRNICLFYETKKEYELKKKIFTFFILSLLIGFSHGSLEILALCSRIIGFFLLYLIRLKWNENSKFWYVVLIHFAYNLLLIIYGIMKIPILKNGG